MTCAHLRTQALEVLHHIAVDGAEEFSAKHRPSIVGTVDAHTTYHMSQPNVRGEPCQKGVNRSRQCTQLRCASIKEEKKRKCVCVCACVCVCVCVCVCRHDADGEKRRERTAAGRAREKARQRSWPASPHSRAGGGNGASPLTHPHGGPMWFLAHGQLGSAAFEGLPLVPSRATPHAQNPPYMLHRNQRRFCNDSACSQTATTTRRPSSDCWFSH